MDKLSRRIQALTILLLINSSLFADRLIMRDGVVKVGDVVTRTPAELVINIKSMRIPLSKIRRTATISQMKVKVFMRNGKIYEGRPVARTNQFRVIQGEPILVATAKVRRTEILHDNQTPTVAVKEKGKPEYLTDGFSIVRQNLFVLDLASTQDVSKLIKSDKPLLGVKAISLKNLDFVDKVTNNKITNKLDRSRLYPVNRAKASSSGFRKFDPRAGLVYSPFAPVAAISEVNFGVISFGAYGSASLPFLNKIGFLRKNRLRTRAGLYVGYHSFSRTDDVQTSDISLIPTMALISLYYDLRPMGSFLLSPSFKLYQGVIFSSVRKELNANLVSRLRSGSPVVEGSYVGYTSQIAFGLEVKHKKQKFIGYFLDLGYMVHAEDLSGTFFTINFGAAYHFYR